MSETTAPAAPAGTVAATTVAEAATAAAATEAASGTGAAEASPAAPPSPPDPLTESILDAPPAEAAPPAPPAPPEPVDPATYEVKLPEGMTREDPMVSAFLSSAGELGMKGDAVQTVLDKMAPLVAEQLAAPMKMWTELNAEWQAAIKGDAEVGGARLGENVTKINGLIDRFGTPELKDALRMTGAANNPHIFKFLAKFANAYSEATPVAAGDSGHATSPAIAAGLSRMYPSAAGAA